MPVRLRLLADFHIGHVIYCLRCCNSFSFTRPKQKKFHLSVNSNVLCGWNQAICVLY